MKQIHLCCTGLALLSVLALVACAEPRASTTPLLDARFGQAFIEAKQQQSLPTSAPLSPEAVAEGAGLTTAKESGPGLEAQQHGRSVTPAFSTAR